LERALAAGVDDPGALEERWLALWVHADEVDARGVQARVESMLRRPAPRETRGRRERLARRVRDRLARG
ncbi:MAG: hypothetical protein KC468_27160, partial [Myxococcales bacterium]|nr:hypothetical protein [Myxococcales bacterium]